MVQTDFIRHYYRGHAGIYDLTRWAFLFGRQELLEQLPGREEQYLAEVGCGTGRNLRQLGRMHPRWRLTGVDVSPDMLTMAARATALFGHRVSLLEEPFGAGTFGAQDSPDIVLFSYSLTMFNPGWEEAILQARAALKPGGHIAVVDFHDTNSRPLRWWMDRHRVRLDGHLLPYLEAQFQPRLSEVHKAWGGMWQYFLFIGQK